MAIARVRLLVDSPKNLLVEGNNVQNDPLRRCISDLNDAYLRGEATWQISWVMMGRIVEVVLEHNSSPNDRNKRIDDATFRNLPPGTT